MSRALFAVRLARHGPVKIKARIKQSDRTGARINMGGKLHKSTLREGDRVCIRRQPVKLRAKKRGKAFKPIQRSGSLKDFCQTRHGIGGRKHAGASTGALLCLIAMRRAVGAEEIAWLATCGRFQQGEAVGLAFGDGQAIVMGPDAAGQNVIAVDD